MPAGTMTLVSKGKRQFGSYRPRLQPYGAVIRRKQFRKKVRAILGGLKETKVNEVKADNTQLTAYRWATQADAQWTITSIDPTIACGNESFNRDGNRVYVKALQANIILQNLDTVAVDNSLVRVMVLQCKSALTDIENIMEMTGNADQSYIYSPIMVHSCIKKVLLDRFVILNRPDKDVYSSIGCAKALKMYKKVKHVANFLEDETEWNNPYKYYIVTVCKKLCEAVAGDTANAVRLSYHFKWTFKDI